MGTGYGYSSKKSGSYGSGIGYSSGKTSHTNREKAIFHGLKAARRWAQNGQYMDAAEIAKVVSECWLESQHLSPPELMDLGEDKSKTLRNTLGTAENTAKSGRYTAAAKKAWSAAAAYMLYGGSN